MGANASAVLPEHEEINAAHFPKQDGLTLTLDDGRKMGYLCYGAPLEQARHHILFFHGTPGSRFFCPDHTLATELGACIVVPERPGFGLSDPQPGRTIKDWAGDVRQIVEKLNIKQFSVIAYSAGGPYGLAVAHELGGWLDEGGNKRSPPFIASLRNTAIISSVSPSGVPQVTQNMTLTFKLAYTVSYYTPSLIYPIVKYFASHYLTNPVKAGRDDWANHHPTDQALYKQAPIERLFLFSALEMYSRGQWTTEAYEYTLWNRPWGFDLAAIQARVCVWQGALDCACTPQMGDYIAKTVPNAKLEMTHDQGHLLFFNVWADVLRYSIDSPGAGRSSHHDDGGKSSDDDREARNDGAISI